MLNCRLIKCNDAGQWMELNKPCVVLVGMGLMIREVSTNTLLADYPKSSIKRVKLLDEGKLAVLEAESAKVKLALKFGSTAESILFAAKLKEQGIASMIHKSDDCFPDLKDKETKEYIKHLLVSEAFQSYVSELSKVLGELKQIDQT